MLKCKVKLCDSWEKGSLWIMDQLLNLFKMEHCHPRLHVALNHGLGPTQPICTLVCLFSWKCCSVRLPPGVVQQALLCPTDQAAAHGSITDDEASTACWAGLRVWWLSCFNLKMTNTLHYSLTHKQSYKTPFWGWVVFVSETVSIGSGKKKNKSVI